jgi:methionine synthase I (cobalamin-dependent)
MKNKARTDAPRTGICPMTNRFLRLLAEKPFLMADGATGTNLFQVGLQAGEAPELWNFEHPERIEALHEGFVKAGADIILTNSFGGTKYRLKLHGAQDRVGEINSRAAEIARRVADRSGREIVVAGSIGPTGELLEPLGSLTEADAIAAFREQALALKAGGVDVLWIETMSAKEEVAAAVKGAAAAGLPIVTTMSFDTNGRTMMGLSPADFVEFVHTLEPRPVAYGANCGVGASDLTATILQLSAAARERGWNDDIIIAKGNAGIPFFEGGKIKYNGTPDLMADYSRLARDSGARIVGGCCGTSAEHLAHMRGALNSYTPGDKPSVETIVARLGPVTAGATAQLAGEDPAQATRRARRRDRTSAGDAAF